MNARSHTWAVLFLVFVALLFVRFPQYVSLASCSSDNEDALSAASEFASILVTWARWDLRMLDEEFRRIQSAQEPLSREDLDTLNAKGIGIMEMMLEAHYFTEIRYTFPSDRQELLSALTGAGALRHLPFNFYNLQNPQPIEVIVGAPEEADYPPGTVIYVPLREPEDEDREPVAYWLVLIGGSKAQTTWESVAAKFEGNSIPEWELPPNAYLVEYQGKAM